MIYIPNGGTAEEIIDDIIERCDRLGANEKIEVNGFGKNKDLSVHITKDEDYKGGEEWNLVDVCTFMDGAPVDDTVGVYVTDGHLYRELYRVYDYKDFSTL